MSITWSTSAPAYGVIIPLPRNPRRRPEDRDFDPDPTPGGAALRIPLHLADVQVMDARRYTQVLARAA